ncbi:MAG: hypothetical protein AAF416_14285 [Pseudomonadota bacterium]
MLDVAEFDYGFYAAPVRCGELEVYESPSSLDKLLGRDAAEADDAPMLVPLFRRQERAQALAAE